MTKTSACRARAAAKLRDPEALNLLARPRFDPASASLHRRLLSLLLVVLVALYAAYEIGRGSSESESFTLSTTAVYERGHDFERTSHADYIARNYGFEISRAIENIWKTVLPDEQSSWIFLDPATQGNIPPSLVSNATDHSAIMRRHAVGTGR